MNAPWRRRIERCHGSAGMAPQRPAAQMHVMQFARAGSRQASLKTYRKATEG